MLSVMSEQDYTSLVILVSFLFLAGVIIFVYHYIEMRRENRKFMRSIDKMIERQKRRQEEDFKKMLELSKPHIIKCLKTKHP